MFTRGLDGRIDDPNAGWKGRGLWVSNNTDGLLHTEKKRASSATCSSGTARSRADRSERSVAECVRATLRPA